MHLTKNQLKESEVELTIEISPLEYGSFLDKAVSRLSQAVKIEGFRPGKAPYNIVKQQIGEQKIYEEALDDIISHFYWQAITQEKLESVGQPKINIEKLAPGNPIVVKAVVSLMPKVTLGNYKSIKIEAVKAEVDQKEVDDTINNIKEMQAKEALVDRPAKLGDRTEIDFEVKLDRVVIEGGQGKKYPLILGSNTMIPGFEDQVVGLTKDQEKEFQLKFPEGYQNKMVAGKLCDFKVKVLAVYERTLPELTDDWAKSLGAESVSDLKKKILGNLEMEKKFEAEQKTEIAMLNKVVESTKFSEIPELLLHNEAHRMVHEFADSISQQGLSFEDYLKNIKKTEEELTHEFEPKALDRVKTSLVLKAIADAEKMEASKEELLKETEGILAQVKGNAEAESNIKSEGYQHYLGTVIRNRKVIEMLKSQIKY